MDSNIYACHRCGEVDVKLWREAQSFYVRPTCVNCLSVILAETDYAFDVADIRDDGTRIHPKMGFETDQIGWWLPAVQVMGDLPHLNFWGYTSAQPSDIAHWRALPLQPQEAS